LIRHVDADPLPPQPLRHRDGGATPAIGVEHDITLVRRRANDAFEQGFGFLGGVTEAFRLLVSISSRRYRLYVDPHIINRITFLFV